MHRFRTNFYKRTVAISMMALLTWGNMPISAFAQAFSIDLTANNQNSLTLTTPVDVTLALNATGGSNCQLTSPTGTSGIASNASITISQGHPWYPAEGGSNTFSVTCEDGAGGTATDSVTVSLAMPAAPAVTIDVKANGSDGPITLNSGDTYTYTWTSANATACEETSPTTSGVSLSGTSVSIGSGHAFYPTTSAPTTITITCTDGTTTATDSVVINLAGTSGGGAVSIDVDANGSDGPITLNSGDTYTYTWTSANATACQMTSPTTSGVALSGSSVTIDSSNTTFYPTISTPTTITITCTDGTNTATDSVVINLAGVSGTTPTVDVKANGSDGPVTINNGDTYTYTWTSANATACQMTSPTTSGVALSGTSVVIDSSNATFYPGAGSPRTITITCTDGTNTATDSVVIQLASVGGGTVPTVDVKANGSDGPVTLNSGDTYTYTWVSANATSCQMTSPTTSGVALSGTSVTIDTSNTTFYPTVGQPVTITIVCTDGTNNATDSVVIQLANQGTPPTPPSGGGGGGGHHRSSGSVSAGDVTAGCPLIRDYMRVDFNNNPLEVMKLQMFLKYFMGYDYVSLNGVFDQATFNAVGAFQSQYRDEILTPWGHTAPTHYVYILTLKKINELYCAHSLPLTADQQHEIEAFRNLLNTTGVASGIVGRAGTSAKKLALADGGLKDGKVVAQDNASTTLAIGTTTGATALSAGILPGAKDNGQEERNNLTAALFAFPHGVKETVQCLYELILILIVLYILGSVLKDVLYSDLPENTLKRFAAKWTAIVLGLLVALILSYLLGEYCLLLPLLIALVLSASWMASYKKHSKLNVFWTPKTEPIKPTPQAQ